MTFKPLEWFDAAARLRRIVDLEKKHGALIEAQANEIQALKDRITTLEADIHAREQMLIIEAKSAAREGASVVASAHVSDISGRLGRIEERLSTRDRSGGRKRLPPSDFDPRE